MLVCVCLPSVWLQTRLRCSMCGSSVQQVTVGQKRWPCNVLGVPQAAVPGGQLPSWQCQAGLQAPHTSSPCIRHPAAACTRKLTDMPPFRLCWCRVAGVVRTGADGSGYLVLDRAMPFPGWLASLLSCSQMSCSSRCPLSLAACLLPLCFPPSRC